MQRVTLDLLRCPFCGTRVSVVENEALVRTEDGIESGVLGCECCAFPVVAGIPVMIADDPTRDAMHALEAGRREEALFRLLSLEGDRADAFRALLARETDATYREAIDILSPDPEGTYFIYRFSDPTFLMAASVLRALARHPAPQAGRALDLCGGTGHLTRVIAGLQPAGETVLADLFFWKLWLARRFTAPGVDAVCCDGNEPLPFPRDVFSLVHLCDAFPYIWRRRLLAEEMLRVAGPDGTVVLPHLHSALGENFAAGMPLTPQAYLDLFAPLQPRLFSDAMLLTQAIEGTTLDLGAAVTPAALGDEPSLTLIASRRDDLFRAQALPPVPDVGGELRINPLYRIERRDGGSVLTLTFPTPEYEEEYGAARRYLPETVTIPADPAGPITPATVGPQYEALRRKHVFIDAPIRYF